MSYSATKTMIGIALVSVVLAGCSASEPQAPPRDVDVVRSEATTQISDLAFLENPFKITKDLQAASSVDEIEELMRGAESENKTRSETYWTCAGDLTEFLAGQWNTQAVDAAGEKFNGYELLLDEGGQASLELVGGAQLMVPIDATAISEWLASSSDQVTQWTADLDEVVADQTLPPGVRPEMSGTQVCGVPFSLTLSAKTDVEWPTQIQRGFRGDITLVVDGQPFDLNDE